MRRTCALLAGLATLAGCGLGYVGHVTLGQARILLGRVSIEDRLDDPTVSAKEKARLRYVLDVRQFALREVGLNDSPSYTTVYDTEGGPAAWNVSASADDAFAPYTWSFPIVGTVPYVGYFDRRRADATASELRSMRYDVLVYGASAYSTLGWFSDPLFTSMLGGSEQELANTICHELAHATVYVAGDSDFNETLATFVGNAGAMDYFRSRGGESDPRLEEAIDDAHDDAVFSHEVSDLRARLAKVYESDAPREAKLAAKATLFAELRVRYEASIRPRLRTDNYDWVRRRELNNALILALERYHGDLDTFEALHRKLGSNLRLTVSKLKEIARAGAPRDALAAAAR